MTEQKQTAEVPKVKKEYVAIDLAQITGKLWRAKEDSTYKSGTRGFYGYGSISLSPHSNKRYHVSINFFEEGSKPSATAQPITATN